MTAPSRLEKFAAKKGTQRAKAKAIEAAAVEPVMTFPQLAYPIMAFDQTLGNFGWVMMAPHESDLYPMIVDYGCIKNEVGNTEDELRLSTGLFPQICDLLRTYHPRGCVLERPWIHRVPGTGNRFESMLLAAQIVWIATHEMGLAEPRMLRAQDMKRMLTGNEKATKKDVRLHVKDLYQGTLDDANEHVCDAVGLGLGAVKKFFNNKVIGEST